MKCHKFNKETEINKKEKEKLLLCFILFYETETKKYSETLKIVPKYLYAESLQNKNLFKNLDLKME